MPLSTTFSQSLLDDGRCMTSNISRCSSLSSLGGRGRQSSFTTQADIDANPLFYTVIKPVLDGKEPETLSSNVQWNESYQDHLIPQSDNHSISMRDSADPRPEPPRARTPFLYRAPGSVSSLRRFDSVSSLATEGSFYQRGRLDDLPEREDSDDMEGSMTEDGWHGPDNALYEENSDNDSTVLGSARSSHTVTPSVSRAQSLSSASSFLEYEASHSGYHTESFVGDYESRDTTPTPSQFVVSKMTYPFGPSRSQTPSSASAFGANQGSQSGYDTEPEFFERNYKTRDTTPTPSLQPTDTMPCFPYRSVSVSSPVRASSAPPPVTSSLPYNTRSGQIPGSYVAKTSTPRRRRAGGESISASPYTRKDGKKGH